MKKKFNIFLIIFLTTFKIFAGEGDDLTGKGLYCYTKDLIVYLDFKSPSNVDVHYLQRYNGEYLNNSINLTQYSQPKYRYKHRSEKYLTTNYSIDINRKSRFDRWIRVDRESLELIYRNWLPLKLNINQLFPFHRGYIQKNDVLEDEESIYCRLENDFAATDVKDYIQSTAQNYNNKIQGKIIEQKKKEEEESMKVIKI